MPAWLAPIAAAGLAYVGGRQANRARRKEAARNRAFQERMRSTEWQAAVADMEAAGINPALAYSMGGASTPGGSMAQQMDVMTPAVSSGMQAARMKADLRLIREQAAKTGHDKRAARAAADLAEGRLAAYGIERRSDGSIRMTTDPGRMPWIAREVQAAIRLSEARARQQGLVGDVTKPLADLSERLGEWLPAVALLSQLSPGGLIRRTPWRKKVSR